VKIGVLAMQGNYQQHQSKLTELGVESVQVKYSTDLDDCDALIIPGGESTTISKLLTTNKLRKSIKDFAMNKPILGTCAGMIILSKSEPTRNMIPLEIMDYSVERNGWGRQVDSFVDNIVLEKQKTEFPATFIRAPKLTQFDTNLTVLATYKNEVVCVTDGKHIACSFHPEIGKNTDIHSLLINNIK